MRVYSVARAMQAQMFPGKAQSQATEQEGFQSGETVKRQGNRNVKTTKISFADMAKRARAGIDTSIKGV